MFEPVLIRSTTTTSIHATTITTSLMEYTKPYAAELHASGLRGLRRPSGDYDEPQLLRRRTGSSRIESPAQVDQERLSNEHRKHTPVSSSFSYEAVDNNGHRRLGDHARPGLFDSIPLTPAMTDSNTVANTRLPTLVRFAGSPDHSRVPGRPETFRTASDGSYHSATSTESAATVVPPGAPISRSGTKLGTMDKFTQKWPEPSPLKIPGIENSIDVSDLTEADLRKSVDAVLLESGIGGSGGFSGLEWFDRWTNFKWCLLFSVFSVFIYGIAGLVCATMTWFRSACLVIFTTSSK